jgi:hypothetical protein
MPAVATELVGDAATLAEYLASIGRPGGAVTDVVA